MFWLWPQVYIFKRNLTGDLDFFVLNAVLERFRYTVVGINLKTKWKTPASASIFARASQEKKVYKIN